MTNVTRNAATDLVVLETGRMRCFELKSLRAFRWAESRDLFAAEGLNWSGLRFVASSEQAVALEKSAIEGGLTITHLGGRLDPWLD
jgi:hypothetical protein